MQISHMCTTRLAESARRGWPSLCCEAGRVFKTRFFKPGARPAAQRHDDVACKARLSRRSAMQISHMCTTRLAESARRGLPSLCCEPETLAETRLAESARRSVPSLRDEACRVCLTRRAESVRRGVPSLYDEAGRVCVARLAESV